MVFLGSLLKFILGAIIVIYLIRKVGGYFLRLFLGKQVEAFQEQQKQQFSQFQQQQTRQQHQAREGEIHVDFVPNDKTSSNKSTNFDGGEYIDYEEVKD